MNNVVILSEAKDLVATLFIRSFASLRMTTSDEHECWFFIFAKYILKKASVVEPSFISVSVRNLFRIFLVLCIITGDIVANIYIPQLAQNFLETSFQNAVIWGVIWYSLLRATTECTTYLLELTSFPLVNQLIQNTQFALCQKWHKQQSSVKEGEMLTYFRRVGFAIRTFYRFGILNFVPAFYKLVIAIGVFYYVQFIDFKGIVFLLLALCVPLLWLPSYIKNRKKGWLANEKSGRVIKEFLHQKNWNALYQDQLEDYLLTQLKRESKAWISNNRARNFFYLMKELCLTSATILIFASVLRNTHFDKSNFILVQTHFMSVLKVFGSVFSSLTLTSEAFAEIQKIYLFLKQPSIEKNIQYGKDVQLQNVSFAYADGKKVFSHFNLTIRKGEKVLLRGDNGAGKSTLIKLLSGELKPQSGIIQRPESFVVIEQEPTLLTETLRFHLTFALPFKPSERELTNALKRVYLEDMSLEKIMSDEVSVGQKIKVLIARALLEKPEVLVLDESFESLSENHAEAILHDILQSVDTVIVVSHQKHKGRFDQVIDLR